MGYTLVTVVDSLLSPRNWMRLARIVRKGPGSGRRRHKFNRRFIQVIDAIRVDEVPVCTRRGSYSPKGSVSAF